MMLKMSCFFDLPLVALIVFAKIKFHVNKIQLSGVELRLMSKLIR